LRQSRVTQAHQQRHQVELEEQCGGRRETDHD
jgi:hypothetical protein